MRLTLTLTALAAVAVSNAVTLLYMPFNGSGTNSAVTNYTELLTPAVNLVNVSFSTQFAQATTISSPQNGQYGAFSGTTINAQGGAPAGSSIAFVGQNGNGWTATFALNLTGWTTLNLTSIHQRSSTGFNDVDLDISTDGGSTWTSLVANYNAATSFATDTGMNVNLPTAAENNANVQLRYTFAGSTSNTGTWRMDNMHLTGEAVPEPGTLLALGAGIAAFAARRRRK